jgi:hypothetical protein
VGIDHGDVLGRKAILDESQEHLIVETKAGARRR